MALIENLLSEITSWIPPEVLKEMGVSESESVHPLFGLLRTALWKGFDAGKLQEREACAQIVLEQGMKELPDPQAWNLCVLLQARITARSENSDTIRCNVRERVCTKCGGTQFQAAPVDSELCAQCWQAEHGSLDRMMEREGTDLKTALTEIRNSLEPGMQQLVDVLIQGAGEGKDGN